MKNETGEAFTEEIVVIDGVTAVRRRQINATHKKRSPYLHVPMECVTILASTNLSAGGWPLALWIIWYHRVSSGEAAAVTAAFAKRAGLATRSARRCAVAALEATGLFEVTRRGNMALGISLGAQLKSALQEKG